MPNTPQSRETAAVFPALCAVIALVLLSSMPIYRSLESGFSAEHGLGAAMIMLRDEISENESVAAFLGLPAPEQAVEVSTSPDDHPFDLAAAVAAYIDANTPAVVLPLDGVLTSPFGRRADPFAPAGIRPLVADSESHYGIDIASAADRTVRAALDGTVRFVGWDDSYGNYLILTHDGCETLYAHCAAIDVAPGQTVRAGERIAEAGDTGRATGVHLHFEVWVEGNRVDPAAWFGFFGAESVT